MAVLTLRIYPSGSHFCTAVSGTGWGQHLAAGNSFDSIGSDCTPYVNESADALDETGYGIIRSLASASYNPGRLEYTFGSCSTGVTISKLRVMAYMRTSSANAVAIAEPPRMRGFVNPAGTRYYQSTPAAYVVVNQPVNRQTQGPTGTFILYTCGEWATNPGTASAWTLADLLAGTFKAGVECGGIAQGQAGDGLPPTPGGSSASLDAAVVFVEIEATPSDLVTEPMRSMLSIKLWIQRQVLSGISAPVAVPLADLNPGDTYYLIDDKLPTGDGAGTSAADWSADPIVVTNASERISGHAATLEGLRRRQLAVNLWSPLHTDLGADDAWTGIPWLDRGGGKTVARAQGGWIHRPNDLLLRDAASNKWRITPWGLSIMGGSHSGSSANTGELTWHQLNSSFSQGTGGEGTAPANGDTTAFTSWTVAKIGAPTVVVKQDSSFLFDVAGYRRCVRITNGTPWATNYCFLGQANAGYATTQRVRVHLKFRVLAGQYPNVTYMLRRTTAPTDWSELSGAFAAADHWVNVTDAIGNAGGASLHRVGDHYEYWSREIVVGGSGSQSLNLRIGRMEQDAGSLEVYEASVVSTVSATGAAQKVIRRDSVLTTNAAIVQVGDTITLNNDESFRIWSQLRGTLTFVFLPRWDHEDLADGATKYLITAAYAAGFGGPGVDADTLSYGRNAANSGTWFFGRTHGITQGVSLNVSGSDLPHYLVPEILSVRWTGGDGEMGSSSRVFDVFRNGVKGSGSMLLDQIDSAGGDLVWWGRWNGAGPRFFADGMFSHIQFRPFPMTDLEIGRLHRTLAIGNALPTKLTS